MCKHLVNNPAVRSIVTTAMVVPTVWFGPNDLILMTSRYGIGRMASP